MSLPVTVVDAGGRELYSNRLDNESLERLDYRIVIEEP
jgi:hypothetical protein